jgi:hypothetical protein
VGNPSRRKGDKFEREIVQIFVHHGMDAKRTPMSGAIAGWEGDVIVTIGERKERIECKRRKSGFKTLYGWLGDNYILAIRDDQTEPLLVMRADDLAQLLAAREPDVV